MDRENKSTGKTLFHAVFYDRLNAQKKRAAIRFGDDSALLYPMCQRPSVPYFSGSGTQRP